MKRYICKQKPCRESLCPYPTKIFAVSLLAALITTVGCSHSSSSSAPDTVALSASAVSVAENGGSATITVSRTGNGSGTVSVDYATTDNTATAGSDYTATKGTLTWADGDTADKTISVTVTDDTTTELDETFTLTLSNPQSASLGTSNNTITITDNDSVAITGTVSAPGATVAFNGPSFVDRALAFLFGNSAQASLSDYVSPVAGVTVSVYEVDATGALVSNTPVTTATTDSFGNYILAAPLDAPASKYIVRAEGTTGTLDSRITSGTVEVDPVSDATSKLVAFAASDLTTISTSEIDIIQGDVSDLVEDIDSASLTTAAALSTGLESAAKTDVEVNNVVTSAAAAGSICGKVTKASGATPLANVLVVAKDYGNWVLRSKAKTAADGTYCLNVPNGDYIVGAINRTSITVDPDRSASEWYNASGGGVFPVNADKVTVANTTPVPVNFDLAPGIRIHGTVTASGGTMAGAFMEGVQVQIRDRSTDFPVASARVNASGTYGVNVTPGTYTVQVFNRTTKPYASQYATSAINAAENNNLMYAKVYDSTGLAVGSSGQTVDFTLAPGYKLSGSITESNAAVTGVLVLVDDTILGGANVRLRSDLNGDFNVWLKPAVYDIRGYGQTDLGVDMTMADHITTFAANVAKQPIVVLDSGAAPVSQAKVLLYDSGGNYMGRAVSSSDGSATLYSSAPSGNHTVVVIIDDPQTHGSIVYDGQTQMANATAVPLDPAVTTPLTSFNVALPDAGVLKVVVTSDGTTPAPNIPTQVRDGGTAASNKFVTNRTRSDGISYLSLPVDNTVSPPSYTYSAVRINGASGANCASIPIEGGKTTTVTFRTDTNACNVGTPM